MKDNRPSKNKTTKINPLKVLVKTKPFNFSREKGGKKAVPPKENVNFV